MGATAASGSRDGVDSIDSRPQVRFADSYSVSSAGGPQSVVSQSAVSQSAVSHSAVSQSVSSVLKLIEIYLLVSV